MASILAQLKARTKEREQAGEIQGGMPAVRIRAGADFAYWNQGGPQPAEVLNTQVPGAFGPTRIRVYRPGRAQPAGRTSETCPTLIYFHGGGWIVGDLELEDRFLRTLCVKSNFSIVSVDYALAPEHPFPQPLEDCLAVAQYIHNHASLWQLDESQMFLGGGSAGANLALATALMLRDASEIWLRGLLLVTGVFTTADDAESRQIFADGRFSPGGPGMDFFLSQYLKDPSERLNPLVCPVLANLCDLPPVHLIAAELDSLRDDSIELDTRLRQAEVVSELSVYTGVIHGFPLFIRQLDAATAAVDRAASWLNERWRPTA